MTTAPDTANDWTLDTNVLIVANGPLAPRNTHAPATKSAQRPSAPPPASRRSVTRELLSCIEAGGVLMWSAAVAQEYQARGAINLKQGVPPVPVTGQTNATYVDFWLARLGSRIRTAAGPHRLSGAEKDALHGAQFHDPGDHRFLELARASRSKRLVTEEGHYNATTIPAIKRILGVRCLQYLPALSECRET